jgi:hypothetical protein
MRRPHTQPAHIRGGRIPAQMRQPGVFGQHPRIGAETRDRSAEKILCRIEVAGAADQLGWRDVAHRRIGKSIPHPPPAIDRLRRRSASFCKFRPRDRRSGLVRPSPGCLVEQRSGFIHTLVVSQRCRFLEVGDKQIRSRLAQRAIARDGLGKCPAPTRDTGVLDA